MRLLPALCFDLALAFAPSGCGGPGAGTSAVQVAGPAGDPQRSSGGDAARVPRSSPPGSPVCQPPAGTDFTAASTECQARGSDCHYEAQLDCHGVPYPSDIAEAHLRALQEGRVPCECVCQADMERCARTP